MLVEEFGGGRVRKEVLETQRGPWSLRRASRQTGDDWVGEEPNGDTLDGREKDKGALHSQERREALTEQERKKGS